MSLSSLISQAYRQHPTIILLNAQTLKEAYYIQKTKLGISEDSYTHCEAFPFCGSSHGIGNLPAI